MHCARATKGRKTLEKPQVTQTRRDVVRTRVNTHTYARALAFTYVRSRVRSRSYGERVEARRG